MSTVKKLIDSFVWDHIEYFTELLDRDGEETVFEGVKVLDEPERFVHGALVNATAQLYIHYVKTADRRAERTLTKLNKFIGFVCAAPCKTWGKLSVLRAMAALHDARKLDSISPETLEILKEKTDYSDFLDKETLTLKGYPSNYLQVAMACAGLREKLGWENDGFGDKLLGKLLDLLKNGSQGGWMDERPPYGRFDRYSMLVTSELSDTLSKLGKPFPTFAADNLREMAKICVFCANSKGDGINYGRSLSCHGDCACLEAIASAFYRGLVDECDKDQAVAYSIKILEKTLNFWYRKDKRSFDIWWDGRSTNRYRQVHRVLEVNLDMAIHLITTLENFEAADMADYEPKEHLSAPENWIAKEVTFKSTVGEMAKTVIARKGDTLAMLPLIGLGELYKNAAYQPYPAICGLLEGAPEANMPFFTPQYTFNDGTICRPIQYYDSIVTEIKNGTVTVKACGTLCKIAEKNPEKALGKFCSEFVFDENGIRANFLAQGDIKRIEMTVGKHRETDKITAYGFDQSTPLETNGVYDFMTPHGAVVCAEALSADRNRPVGYTVNI